MCGYSVELLLCFYDRAEISRTLCKSATQMKMCARVFLVFPNSHRTPFSFFLKII